LPEGVEIREGARRSSLRVAFILNGERRRETLKMDVTPANIKYAGRLRSEVMNAIARGTFVYGEFFPDSKHAEKSKPATQRPTVMALVDGYIDDARRSKSLSPSTIVSYTRRANARIYPELGQKVADDLTAPELRKWIIDMIADLSPKQVRNVVGVLSAVLNRAVSDGVIYKSPLAPISLRSIMPKRKKASEEDKVDPFNDDEVALILKACDRPAERAAIQFCFSTGVRPGEMMAFRWDNVRGDIIRIDETVTEGEHGPVEKTTKTDVERDIPVLPGAREALDEMRRVAKRKGLDYAFLTPAGQRWRDAKQWRDRWRRILLKAGVRYRNPYQTRHTFASRLLMAGEPELLVAALLGHTSVEMIRRHYGKYIKQTGGIVLRGDYSEFGANLGQRDTNKTT
jgi:integrase